MSAKGMVPVKFQPEPWTWKYCVFIIVAKEHEHHVQPTLNVFVKPMHFVLQGIRFLLQ